MPDWSYQTLFRPLLFRLPSRLARGLTLQAMGGLSSLPGGRLLIRTLGHMEPLAILESQAGSLKLAAPVGLSGALDPEGTAHAAMAQFGFGFVVIGPITKEPVRCETPIRREAAPESILYPLYEENIGLEAAERVARKPGHKLPLLARIAPMPGAKGDVAMQELAGLAERLFRAGVQGFHVDMLREEQTEEEMLELIRGFPAAFRQARVAHPLPPDQPAASASSAVSSSARSPERERTAAELGGYLPAGAANAGEAPSPEPPLFLYVPPDAPAALLSVLRGFDPREWTGVAVGEGLREEAGVRVGEACKAPGLMTLRRLRAEGPAGLVLQAGCGVHEPQDALDLIASGADQVLLHSGMVYAGPGLPKRVNEAIAYERLRQVPAPPPQPFWRGWGWMWLLGLGMIIGGVLAWFVAITTVLLPYDEAFLGLDRDAIRRVNERLLHFMSHDRITLAGTMISIGILYMQLAKHGLQAGLHWSRTAVMVSAGVGFSSFFLYLGTGYFDPLHAAAAAILFPMLLLSQRGWTDHPCREPVHLRNDRLWRRAMWGQLCLVMLGFSLAVGGLTIAAVGVTRVFVPEDLDFMQTTYAALDAANPRLIPLIAHDRAGFGGALLSDALVLLVMALWGLQRGARWQWKTLLLGGAPGFAAGFGVHLGIGYTDFWHLSPALFALALYVASLILLYPYLMRPASGSSSD
ncbi:Dihydroorotate dehydrogenase [Paenibacillus sp. UNCCL117]|uniref:hypothetical protein n=1 Tax=unclassified Paenibacillus TaxID=185978 RepID=UPI000888AE61|nr:MULTISPECIES: hypothetical protein [unclassified Paenibacillus]SDD13722.1 Dihydroorotate dehydrogenase [Paenibacillus sp. cl123]SFW34046.1 Dihydroorotate dehydrogenase [Paenibacillus sp. UNCCL117]